MSESLQINEPITTMRDPAGNLESYEQRLRYWQEFEDSLPSEFASLSAKSQVNSTFSKARHHCEALVHRYGRGDSLDELAAALPERIGSLTEAIHFVRTHGVPFDAGCAMASPVWGSRRLDYQFSALALLLLESREQLAAFAALITPVASERSYLLDVLVKAFVPEHRLLGKYTVDRFARPWTEPIVAALAGPPEARAQALGAHMARWCRLMRGYGWKERRDARIGEDGLFCDFAFEVALAVCAYDIDDAGFAAHPYYPADLVTHYRARLRGGRDGWRALGAGAGVAVVAPPAPVRIDLARSKRAGLARWVELVCDGHKQAADDVIEAVGKPRRLDTEQLCALTAALVEHGHAVHADVKDDTSVQSQLEALAGARGLGEFEPPPGAPAAGAARASALLLAFAQWVQARGYRLLDLDAQDDAWHAVLVRTEHADELAARAHTLGIVLREPQDIYND